MTVAAVVTHRRPVELSRLLGSLASSGNPPAWTVIADHAPDGSSRDVVRASGLPAEVLEDPSNPGPGAGWSNAATAALARFPDAGAIWFLDDDVVMPAGGAAQLEGCLAGADLVAPLLEDVGGELWAFPEPEERRARRLIRAARRPADARAALGDGPHVLCWCTGACVLVRTSLYRKIGPHRGDFFLLGEDLEFSMRAAAHGRAVFVTSVAVPHLPPSGIESPQWARMKFCCLLQNLAYVSFRSPHSRHMKRYLPGNLRRFVRTFGLGGLGDALRCTAYGGLCGQPAGGPLGTALRNRLLDTRP